MIMRRWIVVSAFFFLAFTNPTEGQTIREAVVKKSPAPPLIDGRLTEPEWQAAAFTEKFVKYEYGGATGLSTRAKFLWNETCLFIGFVCEDPDVWATLTNRDDHLWDGEVVEILCDPDGDGLNYFEVQVNPLGTELDLLMDKPYSAGGQADLAWNIAGLRSAVSVAGTLNDAAGLDTLWTCEVALPFNELAFLAPSMAFPPAAGDSWRILVTRYDYERTGDKTVEISSWNRTDSRGFHVPEKFGRIIFSDESAVVSGTTDRAASRPDRAGMLNNYPNPFNPSTTLAFDVPIPSNVLVKIFDLRGKEVAVLADGPMDSGSHRKKWDGTDKFGNPAPSGVYLVTVRAGATLLTGKILLSR
jgi:hypothetical protein